MPSIRSKMEMLAEVVTYIKVGQSATTLSGGEARSQAVQGAVEAVHGQDGHILGTDRPALHDVAKLLGAASPDRPGQHGDRHRAVPRSRKTADWIIDIGPEGGSGRTGRGRRKRWQPATQATPAACVNSSEAGRAGVAYRGLGCTLGLGALRAPQPSRAQPTQRDQCTPATAGLWRLQAFDQREGALPLEAARSLARGLRPWCCAPTLPASHPAFATWQGFRQAEPPIDGRLYAQPSTNQRAWRAEPDRRQSPICCAAVQGAKRENDHATQACRAKLVIQRTNVRPRGSGTRPDFRN